MTKKFQRNFFVTAIVKVFIAESRGILWAKVLRMTIKRELKAEGSFTNVQDENKKQSDMIMKKQKSKIRMTMPRASRPDK